MKPSLFSGKKSSSPFSVSSNKQLTKQSSGTKLKSSDKSKTQQHVSETPAETIDNYDEDFEAYEEDFEDFGNDQQVENDRQHAISPQKESREDEEARRRLDEMKKALELENQRANDAIRKAKEFKQETSTHELPSRTFVDLETARKNAFQSKTGVSPAIAKLMVRYNALRELIELDGTPVISILDMPPASEFEVYMRGVGRHGRVQASVQTDEGIDKDTQADDWEVEDKWVQNAGGIVSAGSGTRVHATDQDPIPDMDRTELKRNRLRIEQDLDSLSTFLNSTVPVMERLIEENKDDIMDSLDSNGMQFFLPFSHGFISFDRDHGDICKARHIRQVLISPTDSKTLLQTWVPKSHSSSNSGLVVIWHTSSPQTPSKILVADTPILSAAFGSSRNLVFGGGEDGSLVVWDLRQRVTSQLSWNGVSVSKFTPVYTTASIFPRDQIGHTDGIVAVHIAESTNDVSDTVISVDKSGGVATWSAVDISSDEQMDLGAVVHGRLRLIRTGFSKSSHPDKKSLVTDINSDSSAIFPHDPNGILLGTDCGLVLNVSRLQERRHPRFYRLLHTSPNLVVTSISVSPFNQHAFLVGYSNGIVALFHAREETPIRTWAISEATTTGVQYVQWSSRRPSVFFTVDTESTLSIWDMTENMTQATQSQSLKNYRTMSVSENLGGIVAASAMNGKGSPAVLAIAFENGICEFHSLDEVWDEMTVGEEDVLKQLLDPYASGGLSSVDST